MEEPLAAGKLWTAHEGWMTWGSQVTERPQWASLGGTWNLICTGPSFHSHADGMHSTDP